MTLFRLSSRRLPTQFLSRNMTSSTVVKSKMLGHQASLPKLPVPALDETLSKYLRSVKPLLNETEYLKTVQAVEEFKKPGGWGEKLQERLVSKANDPSVDNWLDRWWIDLAYFGYRDPLPFFSSYYFAYKDDARVKKNTQRAAQIVSAALEFRKAVLSEELAPERTKAYPFCMDSYKWLFNASRYPKIPSDYEKAFDPATNNHIAVVRKNKFYILETVQNGKQLTTAELEQQLDKIVQDAGEHRGPAIGILTTDNRDKWTAAREGLLAASPENAALLEKIESAILLVALDDSSPVTREEISRACWHGDGKNRFFDKSLQFIIFENAKAGFNGEHSSMDATPTARLSDFINHALFNNKINHAYDQPIRSDLVTPKRLDFTVTPLVSRTIQEATQRFDEWVNKHELQVLAYQGFGKNFIKSCKVSPDAFAQMIIQLAYYNMHGVSRPTYESASTRKYLKGRTETIRSVSLESVDFVKSINDPSISNEVKIQKLQAACKAHSKYTVEASDGRGVDRHLLGLRLTLNANEPKPSIFTDPAYSYSSHWNLSTSQLVSEFFQGYGWGEVVPDGYGVPYMINNDSLLFTVTSLRPMKAAHLKHHLDAAATQMKQLFDNAQAPAAPKL